MEKLKKIMMTAIAIIAIGLLGYHWTDDFYAFEEPTFSNIPFTLAIIFWSLIFMLVFKDWVQDNIRDKCKEKTIKVIKAISAAIIAFCVGSLIANFTYLSSASLGSDDIVTILLIPFMGTVIYALREDKNAGWIGGDPSKTPKTGDIKH